MPQQTREKYEGYEGREKEQEQLLCQYTTEKVQAKFEKAPLTFEGPIFHRSHLHFIPSAVICRQLSHLVKTTGLSELREWNFCSLSLNFIKLELSNSFCTVMC